MHKAKIGVLICLGLLLAACNTVPPTQVVLVISSTPDPRVLAVTVTPTNEQTATSQPTAQPTAPAQVTLQPTIAPTIGAVTTGEAPTTTPLVLPTSGPIPAATFGPTQTLSAFPTEVRTQLYIAHQDFQHGYMFWISTAKVIWVLYYGPGNNDRSGEWQSYPDTFVDGEVEIDPTLVPPESSLYQPKRGFGKLWRNTPEIKDALGWATTPEFGLNTTYVYQAGGYLDGDNKFVPRPGKHFIMTLSRQTFALSEPEPPNVRGKWERVS
jgi:hypothetical protein